VGIGGPAAVAGGDDAVRAKFYDVALMLKRRIELFMVLAQRNLRAKSLRAQLQEIGARV